jgi:hypothetical protein
VLLVGDGGDDDVTGQACACASCAATSAAATPAFMS